MKNPQVFEPILYLEGERVAFNSVTVSVQANRPSIMVVTLPPLDLYKDLLPRTLVHLFIRDPEQVSAVEREDLRNQFRNKNGGRNPSDQEFSELLELEEFRLFWEGEFTDISYIYSFSGDKTYNPISEDFGTFNGNLFAVTFGVSVSLSGCYYCD